MGGLNMQSMRSKRGAKEHGDLEVGAHPAPTSSHARPLSTTGARNLKGVKQPTTCEISRSGLTVAHAPFGWQRYLSVQRSTHTVGDGSVGAC